MENETLYTSRLTLVPITVPVVEAVFRGDRTAAEAIVGARLPEAWPGRALIERAFVASPEDIRREPARRLWGDRVMITHADRRVVGSVVFHGAPDADGAVEVAYGVEIGSQRLGFATEAVRASVDWALEQAGVRAVRATTAPWHAASIRVLEKIGFRLVGRRDHELLGELVAYERSSSRILASSGTDG
ncbi:MAG: GNAT family N-acetyltransferase [Polyangiales bacterium]